LKEEVPSSCDRRDNPTIKKNTPQRSHITRLELETRLMEKSTLRQNRGQPAIRLRRRSRRRVGPFAGIATRFFRFRPVSCAIRRALGGAGFSLARALLSEFCPRPRSAFRGSA
jgi:hypothetical protein